MTMNEAQTHEAAVLQKITEDLYLMLRADPGAGRFVWGVNDSDEPHIRVKEVRKNGLGMITAEIRAYGKTREEAMRCAEAARSAMHATGLWQLYDGQEVRFLNEKLEYDGRYQLRLQFNVHYQKKAAA